jgi:fructose PTS system EIIBC or EIIC component
MIKLVIFMKEIVQSLAKLRKHAMTGISYIGPLFTMAAIVKIAAEIFIKLHLNEIGMYIDNIALLLFSLILPVFSMFICYSIADKPGLIPGLAMGWIASNSIGDIPDSGFFGVLLLAFLTGFFIKFAAEKISFKDLYNSVVPVFIIPLLTVIVLIPIHILFIAPVFGSINLIIMRMVNQYGITGQIIYAVITAAAVASDLGGPINKTAILLGTPLSAEFILPMTAINLAIAIPPIGVGLASLAGRFLKISKIYDEDMEELGKDALKLGLIGISEGGLPFLYDKPRGSIIVNIIGSVSGAVIAVALGAVHWYPVSAIWGWLFVENLSAYIAGYAAGVIITALGNMIIRYKD